MNNNPITILALCILLALPTQSFCNEEDQLVEQQEAANDNMGVLVEFRWTLPGCIEFQWDENDRSKLPKAIKVRNPFLEPISFLTIVKDSYCGDFEIEYYDTTVKKWRRPIGIPAVDQSNRIEIKSGDAAILPITKEYWVFINETIQSYNLQDPVRIRLVSRFESTSFQSPEFYWNRKEKKVVTDENAKKESK